MFVLLVYELRCGNWSYTGGGLYWLYLIRYKRISKKFVYIFSYAQRYQSKVALRLTNHHMFVRIENDERQ